MDEDRIIIICEPATLANQLLFSAGLCVDTKLKNHSSEIEIEIDTGN